MPIIQVQMMEGRSEEQRASLIEALTEAAHTSIGAPRESVRVVLVEIPKSNFGIAGKTAKALGR